jgi:hypothetical protein
MVRWTRSPPQECHDYDDGWPSIQLVPAAVDFRITTVYLSRDMSCTHGG